MNKPNHMRFWIGGYRAVGHELLYDGVALQYRQHSPDDFLGSNHMESIPADQNAWDRFRNELDVIGVWDWHPHYDSGALDGTQWEFKIDWQYRRLNIRGSNCYPESEGSPSESGEYTRTFRRFLKALNELSGGQRIE